MRRRSRFPATGNSHQSVWQPVAACILEFLCIRVVGGCLNHGVCRLVKSSRKGQGLVNSQKQTCRICLIIPLFLGQYGLSQTTQPTSEFDTLLLKAEEDPLREADLRSADGVTLGPGQKAEIERSNEIVTKAESARERAECSEAARQFQAAFEIRKKILGDEHYLSVSAKSSAAAMNAREILAEDQQQRLAQADQKLRDSKAFTEKGDYEAALAAVHEAFAIREEILPEDDAEIASALMVLCQAELDRGRFKEAEKALRRAIPIINKTFGPKHPMTARAFDRFGWLRFVQARQGARIEKNMAADAVEALDRAVRILNDTVGETLDTAESLDNLGSALVFVGSGRQALKHKMRSLVIRRRLEGPDAVPTGVSWSNLAWYYEQSADNLDLIIPLRQRAMRIFEKRLSPKHPYVLSEQRGLLRAYLKLRKHDEAINLLEAIVASLETESGPIKPESATLLAQLGATYLFVGRVDDAVRTFERADDKAQALHKDGNRQAAVTAIRQITQSCQRFRMLDLAVKYLERLVAWDKERGGEQSPAVSRRAASLGMLYVETGRISEAVAILEKAVTTLEEDKGKDHAGLALPLLHLARAYEKQGKLSQAEKTADRAVGLSESHFERNARVTGYAIMQLGRAQALLKQFDMAEFHLKQAREILTQHEKTDARGALESLDALARLQTLRDNFEEAAGLLRDGLERCRKLTDESERPFVEAAEARFLRQLLELPESHSGGDRTTQRAELKALLVRMKANKALTAEELKWLEELQ